MRLALLLLALSGCYTQCTCKPPKRLMDYERPGSSDRAPLEMAVYSDPRCPVCKKCWRFPDSRWHWDCSVNHAPGICCHMGQEEIACGGI